jgi:hypothetical protein
MRTSIKRALAPLAVASALVLTGLPPASANHLPFPGPPLHFDAGVACEFELLLDWEGGKLHSKDFRDKDGRLVRSITAGKGVVLTYTNVEAETSVTVNTAGSVARTVYNKDGTYTVTATGHNGLILFPSDVPMGPTTTHYVGRLVYNVDPRTGVFTFMSSTGRVRDICAELSS